MGKKIPLHERYRTFKIQLSSVSDSKAVSVNITVTRRVLFLTLFILFKFAFKRTRGLKEYKISVLHQIRYELVHLA